MNGPGAPQAVDAGAGVNGPVPVVVALTGLAGEPEVVAALAAPGSGACVVRRCLDAADLLASAARGPAVAVVSAGFPRLGRDVVARLAAHGVAVVGVHDADDPCGADILGRLGAPVAVPVAPDGAGGAQGAAAGAAAPVLAAVLAAAGRARPGPGVGYARPPGAPGASGPGASGPSAADGPEAFPGGVRPGGLPPGGGPGRPAGRGSVVAVWGPTGAPGRTSVAVALADEAARLGVDTLLVDADTYGAAVAPVLGLLDDVSGIAVACRTADAGALDVAGLAAAARTLAPRLRVLTGLPDPGRWPELRPAALADLWRVAAETVPLTVVDCGFGLEQDEELVFDTLAPRRNAATLTALEAADAVVAVGGCDHVGVARLLAGLPRVAALAPAARPRVVVTRVRRGPLGRDPDGQVAQALAEHAPGTAVRCVPDDRAGYDAALRAGGTLGECAPGSPARAALAAEAAALARGLGLLGAGPARARGRGGRRSGAGAGARRAATA